MEKGERFIRLLNTTKRKIIDRKNFLISLKYTANPFGETIAGWLSPSKILDGETEES